MKTIIKTAIVALTLTAGATAGQAETVWHFPHKGACLLYTSDAADE